jgi:AcrR family transcriptional regulator
MAPATSTRRSRLDQRTRAARAQGLDAREELLEAAVEVFARRGFREASVGEIAQRAGYSKGAIYWHFAGKDDLFFALLEERIDQPMREMIELLQSAPPEQDMAPEASKRFVEVLRGQRATLLLDHEYWSQAVRDPALRARYAKRQAQLRSALGRALATRLEHLGAPPLQPWAEEMATAIMGLAAGLAQEKLIDPDAVPDHLLGETIALIYRGFVAREQARLEGDPG